ncbi:AtpZ/AtpI family protein [Aequorivita sp. F47161]|jgi:cell shape-determining protein MreD|uniref:AtpZ/AtpI family protein n=1 Tax=Aequorivita vitellina TaxID=2874475 RepID=A0A9X1TYX7_9FLAO|nr:AtpZ/AtpI family protein [Aequorivita vitellina]MCG2417409.1 AtpZ/AtpI family protein [Aequorivita vitellina]
MSDNNNNLRKWAVFSGIAIQMGVTIGIGVFAGNKLDEIYPNQYSAYTIIFSLLGVFIALYAVIKQLQNMNKKD